MSSFKKKIVWFVFESQQMMLGKGSEVCHEETLWSLNSPS